MASPGSNSVDAGGAPSPASGNAARIVVSPGIPRVGAPCELCHEEARVRVLEGYVGREPSFRHYCLSCADQAEVSEVIASHSSGRERLGWTSLLIATGLAVGIISVLADDLGAGGSAGFGRKQMLGALIGSACLVTGALLHVDLLGLFGTILFGFSVTADLIKVGDSPGVGHVQAGAIAASLSLVIAGALLRYRKRRHGPAGDAPVTMARSGTGS